MRHKLHRIALAGMLLVPLFAAAAHAQSPTPEGTVITNTATASYTDANGNTYTNATASVQVTVGFAAGIDVQGTSPITPASGSTGNEQNFTLVNNGNGTDQFSVATTAGTGITITGYKIGSTTYETLAALNTALAATNVTAGGNVVVTVVYDVSAGAAGTSTSLALTGTSVRDSGSSDTFTTTVNPPAVSGVTVTPDGTAVNRLPSNGVQYTATYTINNTSSSGYTFDLSAVASNGAVVSVVSVNGTAGASGTVTIGAGSSTTVDVVYTVANAAAAGATSNLTLTATAQGAGSVTDNGYYAVTVIRAAISMTKQAYLDDGTTLVSGNVLPGQYIRYKITVTNNGVASASTVSVSDPLPAEVTYQSHTDDGGSSPAWSLSHSSGTVTGTLTTLAASASRHFWIRVQIK